MEYPKCYREAVREIGSKEDYKEGFNKVKVVKDLLDLKN